MSGYSTEYLAGTPGYVVGGRVLHRLFSPNSRL